jgi:hypothetical protein
MLLLVLLVGCTNSFYHVATVQSDQVKAVGKDFVFENDDLKVVYNFWEKGGRMRFLLFNKTDKPIYIDWSKSFLVRNDSKTPYSQLPVFSGRAFKDTVRYIYQNSHVEPYRMSARNNSILELPSQTYVAIADFPIQQTVSKSRTKEKVFSYTKETTPLRFGQRLTYSFEQTLATPHQIEHAFWVNQIQVVREGQLVRQYGSLEKGQPTALYAVEKRLAGGRIIVITLASVAVSYIIIIESLKDAFSGLVLCC